MFSATTPSNTPVIHTVVAHKLSLCVRCCDETTTAKHLGPCEREKLSYVTSRVIFLGRSPRASAGGDGGDIAHLVRLPAMKLSGQLPVVSAVAGFVPVFLRLVTTL